ncbi:hypothetical protein F5B20DRAFT_537394 [Whalleya microplaca]|nr:hypothetical protein F5B20DRAFT_537394 [Whalleya microplaca]
MRHSYLSCAGVFRLVSYSRASAGSLPLSACWTAVPDLVEFVQWTAVCCFISLGTPLRVDARHTHTVIEPYR